MMWVVKLLLVVGVAYAGVVILAWSLQTRLIFPAGLAGAGSASLPPAARTVELDLPGGDRLEGILIPGAEKTLVIGFGGNAWNASDVALYLHDLYPEVSVLAFHYRGYPPSTGRPGAAALKADALRVHDFGRDIVDPERIATVGFSIGAGVAAHLAARRDVDGVILVTPFDSLRALARDHYPWLPIGLLLRHRLSTLDALREVEAPVAIVAAANDRIVPPARTAPLRDVARNLVLDETIPGAGHNDLYEREEFVDAMRRAMKLIGGAVGD